MSKAKGQPESIMPISLHPRHLQEFKKTVASETIEDSSIKRKPREWAKCTNLDTQLPDCAMTRQRLLKLACNSSSSTAATCWSILAWGGMKGRHRDALNKCDDQGWLELASEVRGGEHDRASAYEGFAKLRREGKLPGMGPAFFTKLIFFLMPRGPASAPPGYIMDQWVGCSINILAQKQIVLMDCKFEWIKDNKSLNLKATNFIVSHANDSSNYESYCLYIEEVAQRVTKPPSEVEFLLMSKGGKSKKSWRQYVIENRQPPHE